MIKKVVALSLIAALGAVVILGAAGGRQQLEISNAYITGRVLNLAAHADGVVDRVNVSRGDRVARGELMLALDSERDASAINKFSQQFRVALKAELTNCLAIEIASNAVVGVEAKIDYLQERTARIRKLTQASVAAVDELRSLELSLRQEQVAIEQEKLKLTLMNVNEHESLMDRPSVQLAANQLREAYYRKHMNEVRAPYEGYVYEVLGYPGAYAKAGESQIIFVPTERPTVEANVLESELPYIKPGLRVKVIADVSESREPIDGYVQSIVPSSAATFSKLPRNNVDSNWIKVSQRVPVLIALIDNHSQSGHYPIGTSVRVLIPTEATPEDWMAVEESKVSQEASIDDAWVTAFRSTLTAIIENESLLAAKALGGRCKAPR